MSGRWVLHVDLDQFLAAVEQLRRPELRGRPVVIGGRGDPTERGVVSTASYEARRFGVGSGMPLRIAARKCPDAVFLPVDAPAYLAVSRRVMDALRSLDVVVEVLGWDEAFLGVTTDDPETFARDVQRAVLDATGLHCSVGIGDNKLRAKIATGFGKPQGMFRLTAANWRDVMAERPTDALWGIGRKTAKRLAALGIASVGELMARDPAELAAEFGPATGPWLSRLGHGDGSATVSAEPYVARSHSRESTYQRDLTDRAQLEAEVRRLAAQAAEDARQDGRAAVRVAVKVRYAPFQTHTRSAALPRPTADTAEITGAAVALLDRFDQARPVRLLGVRVEMVAPGADPGILTASRPDTTEGLVTEPEITTADDEPVVPDEDELDGKAYPAGPLPVEANEADVLEQSHELPPDEDYPEEV